MASNSETGHAKNVANFEKMVVTCTSYSTTYNPGNSALQIQSLESILSQGKDSLTSVQIADATYNTLLSDRDLTYKPFGKLITRISNAVKSSAVSADTKNQVKSLVRKLQGRRATPLLTIQEKQAAASSGKKIVEISSSQMSFDNRMGNFGSLIHLLASLIGYVPNEPELTVVALEASYSDLKVKNLAAITAEIPLNNLRIRRNEILYQETSGLVDVANGVKAYIKSVFGATSPQYKQVSSLRFKKYKM